MHLNAITQGLVTEPPGSYAVPFMPKTDQVSAENDAFSQPGSRQDTYTSRTDSTEGIAPTLPEAIANSIGNSKVASCYCGHCAACNLHAAAKSTDNTEGTNTQRDTAKTDKNPRAGSSERADENAPGALSEAEQQQVNDLQRRDQEVRAHEQAHVAAGATSARYDYQTGPDGRQYAVGGSADIQISAMSNDYASRIAQARKMRAAALAPADPSPQDLAVAANATRLEQEARAEKSEADHESLRETADPDSANTTATAAEAASREPFFALA
jgi:hypothetical protein